MAYTPPTLDAFLERFPEFEEREEAAESALADAASQVDETWREADYPLAIMLLAAHYLELGPGGGSASGAIASESMGGISVSYARGSNDDGYAATEYGRRYKALLNANFPPVVVI